MTIANSILPALPCRIPLPTSDDIPVLKPGINIDIPLTYHASRTGENRLYFLLVFREVRDFPWIPAPARAELRLDLLQHFPLRLVKESIQRSPTIEHRGEIRTNLRTRLPFLDRDNRRKRERLYWGTDQSTIHFEPNVVL